MYTRNAPFFARIRERRLLNAPSSTKQTYHISLDISGSQMEFKPGDSIGVIAQNNPDLVDQILPRLQAKGNESIREFLLRKANLQVAFERLEKFPSIDLASLPPLLPRFYSIASSPRIFPNEIHLLVSYINGVASHFLCHLAQLEETPIPIYVQPARNFALPADPAAPIILVGPGTGVAPFRAFLQERTATQASGANWLFFGERQRAFDYYYEDFWHMLQSKGHLKLHLAFSRDEAQKVYVQHKLYEHRKEIWQWIHEQRAHFYVCGDAKKMAKDVESMFLRIASEEGKMNESEARLYLKSLRAEKRYLLDVY